MTILSCKVSWAMRCSAKGPGMPGWLRPVMIHTLELGYCLPPSKIKILLLGDPAANSAGHRVGGGL